MEHRTFFYQDMPVSYWTAGKPDKHAVLFLHPAFADHTMFEYQIPYFERNYFVIAIDMVAHGKSQPRKARVDMSCMPEIIVGILDGLGVEKVYLVGVSLGSIVSQAFATVYPERTASVTIVGGYSIHKDNKHIQKAQRKEVLRWVWYVLTSMEKFKAYVVDMSVRSAEGKAIFTEAISSFTRRSLRFMGGMERFFVDKSTPVPYPIQIMCGEYDTPLALEAGKRLTCLEPHSWFAGIENAGHCANIDNPSAFNEGLRLFLHSIKQ